jgi:hypothetical protein
VRRELDRADSAALEARREVERGEAIDADERAQPLYAHRLMTNGSRG